jgi:hypothetical protein
MPALPLLNEEQFPSPVLEAAIRNLESTDLEHPDPLDAGEYPEGAAPLRPDSSFYQLALDFCEKVIIGSDPIREDLVNTTPDDIIPLSALDALYRDATGEELTLLWLLVTRNWEGFRVEVERTALRHVLEQSSFQQVA